MRALRIRGGRLWTGEAGCPRAEEMLVLGERIVAVGTTDEIERHPSARDARSLDLSGESVVPGMTDGHLHLNMYAKQRFALDLEDAVSLRDLLERIRNAAATCPPDRWIYGVKFNNARWNDPRMPNRWDLDGLGLFQPVVLQRICTHVNVANGRALLRGGLIGSPESDHDGVLLEEAAFPLLETMKAELFGGGRMEELLGDACRELASYGVTSIHPCGADYYGMEEGLDLYQGLFRKNKLPVRVFSYHDKFPVPPLRSGFGDGWVTFQGYKLYLDGTIGARTAALSEPYADDPDNRGLLNHSLEHLIGLLREARARGLQTLIHTIGDAALDQALDALEAVESASWPPLPYPYRINHLQVCRPDQVARLAALPVFGDVQPSFVPSDLGIAPLRLGLVRVNWSYAWRTLLEAGIPLSASSDSPVESLNPWRGVWAAVNRTDDAGNPEGGFLPDQKLGLDQTLHMFTTTPARAVGREKDLGRLAPGCLADFAVLEDDLFAMPQEELLHVKVRFTFAGGACTWGDLDGWERIG